jgi:hypothetical protein
MLRAVAALASALFGTNTNDNAAAGHLGEFITSTVATPGTVLATGVAGNVTSIVLTAGDWDVSFTADFAFAATTSYTAVQAGLGSATGVMLGQAGGGGIGTDPNASFSTPAQVPTALPFTLEGGPTRVSLAATTTIYLNAVATFTVAGLTVFGTIRARRVR